ncbi:MAG: thermonuclease family protein, partial [Caulobacteraceae bacterium]
MITAFVTAVALQSSMPVAPLIGRATVIDGDTLEIGSQRVRLWGVDAPEGRQSCMRDGQAYR